MLWEHKYQPEAKIDAGVGGYSMILETCMPTGFLKRVAMDTFREDFGRLNDEGPHAYLGIKEVFFTSQ